MNEDDGKTPLWMRRRAIPRYKNKMAISLKGEELPDVDERVWWRARVICHLGTGQTLVRDEGEAEFGRTYARGVAFPQEYRIASWVIPHDLRFVGSRFYVSDPRTHESWGQVDAEDFRMLRRYLWDLLRPNSFRIVARTEQSY